MTTSKKIINSSDKFNTDSKNSLEWMTHVLQSSMFSALPPENIQQLFDLFELQNVKADEVIIKQGDHGDYYYLIQSGRCSVIKEFADTDDSKVLAELKEGDYFGEQALIGNTQRNATVKMITDGVLLRLKKDDFLHQFYCSIHIGRIRFQSKAS